MRGGCAARAREIYYHILNVSLRAARLRFVVLPNLVVLTAPTSTDRLLYISGGKQRAAAVCHQWPVVAGGNGQRPGYIFNAVEAGTSRWRANAGAHHSMMPFPRLKS